MPRLQRLHNNGDYVNAAQGHNGRFILTNVTFGDGKPEAIRLNLAAPNCGIRRVRGCSKFPIANPPFDIASPALMISFDQLEDWKRNFAVVREAVGGTPLGRIQQNDPRYAVILNNLQSLSLEIARIDQLFTNLAVHTDLYDAYAAAADTIPLLPAQNNLLQNFSTAASVYCQVSELGPYFEQNDPVMEGIGPRGQRFRDWFARIRAPLVYGNCSFEYVGYELRPLRLSGFNWGQGQNGDLRRVAVDLLCKYRESPVWCEVKMDGDSWTSAAVQQIFFYGSMLCGKNQEWRCRRQFPNQFANWRGWLAVIVEDRENAADFNNDFNDAVNFARDNATRTALGMHFEGMLFIRIRELDDPLAGWEICSPPEIIEWR